MQESRDFGILGRMSSDRAEVSLAEVSHTKFGQRAEIGGGELMNIGWE